MRFRKSVKLMPACTQFLEVGRIDEYRRERREHQRQRVGCTLDDLRAGDWPVLVLEIRLSRGPAGKVCRRGGTPAPRRVQSDRWDHQGSRQSQ